MQRRETSSSSDVSWEISESLLAAPSQLGDEPFPCFPRSNILNRKAIVYNLIQQNGKVSRFTTFVFVLCDLWLCFRCSLLSQSVLSKLLSILMFYNCQYDLAAPFSLVYGVMIVVNNPLAPPP
jgi:hypothetical protein